LTLKVHSGLTALVASIRQADALLAAQAVKAVNLSLTVRNWYVGYRIAEFELRGAGRANYGDRLIPELAKALRGRKVSSTGARQLYSYLAFYRAYPNILRTASAKSLIAAVGLEALKLPVKIVRTVSALSVAATSPPTELLLTRLSYSHFELLVEQEDALKRCFYEIESLRANWSVRELRRQIDTQYFERSSLSKNKRALALTTRTRALGAAAKAVAEPAHAHAQIIRDPYVFEFIGLDSRTLMTESHLEDALLNKLQSFLLELGHGFCFEARQRRVLIGGEHFHVDLVFYHRVLKCRVLIELKNDKFRHEHLGQLNAYVSYFKQHEMNDGDAPPIGILLCTGKNEELVQFALADMTNKLFVSKYQVRLPDKKQITAFLQQALRELKR
jgi:predicted nuclease of restriction endonuclease-like (RecB) superfamily